MAVAEQTIKKILLDNKLVTLDQYASAEKTAKHLNVPVAEVLVGRRLIKESQLGELIAQSMGTHFIDLKQIDIPTELIELIPQEMAINRRVIPFAKEGNQLMVAMEDPNDLETIEFVRKKTDLAVIPYYATPTGIKYALRLYKKGIKEFVRLLKEWTKTAITGEEEAEELAQDISIVRIFDTIVEYAVAENASDIHIEALPSGVLIRYRIDGILHDIITLPHSLHNAIVARVKILSNLKLDETRLPQDGRFRHKTEEGEFVSLRVSILPTVEGEKVVLRLLESELLRFSLEGLGFTEKDKEIVEKAIHRPHGQILVTGPTGSGKTTTLYTILGILNTPEVNISTVEDPVENKIPRITQTQINPQIGLTFAEGLRALLRQDPNIIMVGEIRDKETGGIAVNAAMTGHLVLSTLHTNDAPSAIPRLIDLGVEPFLIASTLNLVMAQRLVRLICTHCMAEEQLSKEVIKELDDILSKEGYSQQERALVIPQKVYKGEGCNRCNYTGYQGRMAIYEVFSIDNDIRSLIVKRASAEVIKKSAIQKGMSIMLYDGLKKVKMGKTTIEEVLRVTAE